MRHLTPSFRTFSGEDALESIPVELERLGATRAVVICGASMSRHEEALASVTRVLGSRWATTWDGVREHSPLPTVLDARDVLLDAEADAVIAVGGGSAIVTARAATILVAEGRDIRRLCTHRDEDGRLVSPRLTAPKLPQWVVPTTPTTASATAASAVLDPLTGERLALFDPKARAQGVFLDPSLALTAPEGVVRSAALNALSMSVEGLESEVEDPLAEALLRHALYLLARLLPALTERPDDAQLRVQLMFGALLCGQGISYVGGGLAQAISHAAGPRSAVANGVVEAMLLPHVMRYSAPVARRRLAGIEGLLVSGASDGDAEAAIAAVEDILAASGVPDRLRDVGLPRDAIDDVVEQAVEDWAMTSVPRPANRAELTGLVTAAW